jgi:hypothetical protein
MRRALTLLASSLIASVTLVVVWAQAAGAWTWPMNQFVSYYMPGPPPGYWLSGCDVTTMIGETSGYPQASINPQSTWYSLCTVGYVQVVFAIPGGIGASAWLGANPNTTIFAVGPYGGNVIGANFIACNVNAYCNSWSVTVPGL